MTGIIEILLTDVSETAFAALKNQAVDMVSGHGFQVDGPEALTPSSDQITVLGATGTSCGRVRVYKS
jgi:hypothetical protein